MHIHTYIPAPQVLTAVSDLGPLLELRVVSEDLHGGLGVWVEGRLEAQLRYADLLEEGLDRANQVTQGQVAVRHQALHL